MMLRFGLLLGLVGLTFGQFPGAPHGAWGGANRPGGYPKPPQSPPGRPSPFSAITGGLSGGSDNSGVNAPPGYDDPISQIPHDSKYDSQALPAKLPILAPNGVVEIYNRVVDDLIQRLESDFTKKKMDPMPIVIRSTPQGPVRVPGYLQRRPFRRPGAALYRTGGAGAESHPPHFAAQTSPLLKKKKHRSNPLPTQESSRFPEGRRPSVSGAAAAGEETISKSVRGVGKISKGPLSNEDVIQETTPAPVENVEVSSSTTTTVVPVKNVTIVVTTEEPSSEEEAGGLFIRARSDEDFLEDEEEENKSARPSKIKKTKKDETAEDDDEDEKTKQDVQVLLERYSTKNGKTQSSKTSASGTTSTKNKSTEKKEEAKTPKPVIKSTESEDDDDEDEIEIRDEMDDELNFGGGNGRPQGGYYPPSGPPSAPSKPNAVLTGLSKIRRASDVAVSVDARSAMITARLLVGPLNVYVNESVEPKERGLKAIIPELEAEIILMERHGVVFLQRFTLDRAYGQDVEISIPKAKGGSNTPKKQKPPMPLRPGQPGFDPNPAAEDRYRTKMAAHISMEIVKLLRSGNLRVNLMRTAQGSMSKLKLPIMKPKKKKAKKERKDVEEEEL